jgi:hypothetical protein
VKCDNELLPIYACIYNRLLKLNKPYLYNRDLAQVILNFRLNGEVVDFSGIKKELAALGLTKKNIDKVCSYISWKMRFSLDDIYDIKQVLLKEGYLSYGKGHKIIVKPR